MTEEGKKHKMRRKILTLLNCSRDRNFASEDNIVEWISINKVKILRNITTPENDRENRGCLCGNRQPWH